MDAVASASPWVGLFGLLLAGLYAILGGRLVPAATVDRLTSGWEARLAESHQREQDWHTAYERTEESRDVNAQQLGELIVYAQTMEALLRALPQPSGGGGGT